MPEKPKPLGRPVPRSDEDLERLALTTPLDVPDVRIWLKDNAGGLPRAETLWEAPPGDLEEER